MRAERIRKEIENGTYETEGKLRIAISRLIDDVLPHAASSRHRARPPGINFSFMVLSFRVSLRC